MQHQAADSAPLRQDDLDATFARPAVDPAAEHVAEEDTAAVIGERSLREAESEGERLQAAPS
jgi:hypothetical protein